MALLRQPALRAAARRRLDRRSRPCWCRRSRQRARRARRGRRSRRAQSRGFEIALGLALPAAVAFAVLAEPIAARAVRARRLRRARHRGSRRGAGGDLRRPARPRAGKGARRGSFAHEDTRTPMLAALPGSRPRSPARSLCFRATAMSGRGGDRALRLGRRHRCSAPCCSGARLASPRPRRAAGGCRGSSLATRPRWALVLLGAHDAARAAISAPTHRSSRASAALALLVAVGLAGLSGEPRSSSASRACAISSRAVRRPAPDPVSGLARGRAVMACGRRNRRGIGHGVQGAGVFRRAADRQPAPRQLSRRDREVRRAAGELRLHLLRRRPARHHGVAGPGRAAEGDPRGRPPRSSPAASIRRSTSSSTRARSPSTPSSPGSSTASRASAGSTA